MPILTCTNVKHAYGDDIILEGVTLSIEPGERVGIVGRNGGGKSTLIKILAGELTPDEGQVVLQRGERLGYLRQDPEFDKGQTLRQAAEHGFAELSALHRELDALFESMAGAGGEALDKLLKQQAELERRIEAAGGYAIDHKIDEILHGLGFTDAQFKVPVSGLSGGQRARLSLAQLLLSQPGVLLLDEPTNHLDLDGRLWLEAFLAGEYPGAVVMISHDRAMLNGVVSRIAEVERGRLIDYPGNYEAFRRLRAERREAQHRAWANEQDQFRKEEAFIRKFKAGQRAKQARGRESRLERAKSEAIERPIELAELRLSLPRPERTGDLVVVARELAKKYRNDDGSDKVLFHDLSLTIGRGERWGIVGPNGAGKTTLVRCLLGELEPDAGTRSLGAKVDVGYFRQVPDGLRLDLNVYRFVQDRVKKETDGRVSLSEQEARNLCGAFLFSGDEQEKEVRLLSGGERARAIMAGLLSSAKNVLVLDEPTNHLDISSAERLEDALAAPREDPKTGEKTGGAFDGTLILISHDRALIDATCDHLLVLDGHGGAEVFLGTWSEWAEGRAMKAGGSPRPTPSARQERGSAEGPRSDAEKDRKSAGGAPGSAAPRGSGKAALATSGPKEKSKSKFSWMRVEQLEERIAYFEEQLAELDRQLADPDVWADHEKANAITDRRDGVRGELDELEAEWLRKAE
ncbi:MAG: ABC-F family ATP-binding cassette domain-containing protein [Phycisphaerales bacterium JB040]